MDRRAELGKIFREILGNGNVYFRIRYMVTVIDSDPDSKIVNRVSMLPYCYFDRHYVQDNLNHDVFEIYF